LTAEEYRALFFQVHAEKYLYLKRWYHSIPFLAKQERNAEYAKFGDIMYRCVLSVAKRYRDFNHILQLSPRTLEILDLVQDQPYAPGTFRPDILLCADGTWRACEITSRFMYSGYYASCFTDLAAEHFAQRQGITDRKDQITPMFEYAMRCLEDVKTIAVIKSDDKPEALKLYQPYFEAMGKQVTLIPFDAYLSGMQEVCADFLISEIKQTDLWKLNDRQLMNLFRMRYMQDIRSAFLPHDKHFFALLRDDAFTNEILTAEETAFLRAHIVTTYIYGSDHLIWQDAKANKNEYILKHARLGKSEKVYAGCTMTQEEWNALYQSPEISDMILQPFMQQRKFATHWEGQDFSEYAVATILLFDDLYFGPGLIRGSTYPVTNQGDDRKFIPIMTNQTEKLGEYYIL